MQANDKTSRCGILNSALETGPISPPASISASRNSINLNLRIILSTWATHAQGYSGRHHDRPEGPQSSHMIEKNELTFKQSSVNVTGSERRESSLTGETHHQSAELSGKQRMFLEESGEQQQPIIAPRFQKCLPNRIPSLNLLKNIFAISAML